MKKEPQASSHKPQGLKKGPGTREIHIESLRATGVGASVLASRNQIATVEDATDAGKFVWKEAPGGVVYKQIPYLWPFNAPNSWNLNVAKFKAHTMGLTLASKNWQGSNASPFQGYCGRWPAIDNMQKVEKVINRECIHPNVREIVEAEFMRHRATIPRWDTPDYPREAPGYVRLNGYTTLCMELWAQRTIDNHAASEVGLHVVEGIYGRGWRLQHGAQSPWK